MPPGAVHVPVRPPSAVYRHRLRLPPSSAAMRVTASPFPSLRHRARVRRPRSSRPPSGADPSRRRRGGLAAGCRFGESVPCPDIRQAHPGANSSAAPIASCRLTRPVAMAAWARLIFMEGPLSASRHPAWPGHGPGHAARGFGGTGAMITR